MNILYGVQATGNGHISRSRELVGKLKENGHRVHVILSGREPEKLWDIDIFEPYNAYQGLTFAFSSGKVKYFQTIKNLHPINLYRDINRFKADDFDLVIVDFEPVAARIAKRNKIPSIGIGHQYAFHYPVPLAKWDPIALAVIKYFAPADYSLGLHWHHFGHPILPPIIPELSISEAKNNRQNILVYLPFEKQEEVIALLRPFTDHHFYYYTEIAAPRDEGHMHLRPFSRDGFIRDLMDCGGVMCNAGFELSSEALHLGKKLLVRPLAGQLEQSSNALALTQLGLGIAMDTLDPSDVKAWLEQGPQKPTGYPDVAGHIADWIGEGKWDTVKELAERVWSEVQWTPGISSTPHDAEMQAHA